MENLTIEQKREMIKSSNNGFFSQFSKEQLKNQYRENLKGLIRMQEKSKVTGKKVNGYSLIQLNELVRKYTNLCK